MVAGVKHQNVPFSYPHAMAEGGVGESLEAKTALWEGSSGGGETSAGAAKHGLRDLLLLAVTRVCNQSDGCASPRVNVVFLSLPHSMHLLRLSLLGSPNTGPKCWEIPEVGDSPVLRGSPVLSARVPLRAFLAALGRAQAGVAPCVRSSSRRSRPEYSVPLTTVWNTSPDYIIRFPCEHLRRSALANV